MKKTIDYETTDFSIYKFVCLSNPTISIPFVGATSCIVKMKQTHKQRYTANKSPYLKFVYDLMRENGGIENWRLLELERKKFANKLEVDLYCYETLKMF